LRYFGVIEKAENSFFILLEKQGGKQTQFNRGFSRFIGNISGKSTMVT